MEGKALTHQEREISMHLTLPDRPIAYTQIVGAGGRLDEMVGSAGGAWLESMDGLQDKGTAIHDTPAP